jgi:hypothetical protein
MRLLSHAAHQAASFARRTALPGRDSVWHYLDSKRMQETSQ